MVFSSHSTVSKHLLYLTWPRCYNWHSLKIKAMCTHGILTGLPAYHITYLPFGVPKCPLWIPDWMLNISTCPWASPVMAKFPQELMVVTCGSQKSTVYFHDLRNSEGLPVQEIRIWQTTSNLNLNKDHLTYPLPLQNDTAVQVTKNSTNFGSEKMLCSQF